MRARKITILIILSLLLSACAHSVDQPQAKSSPSNIVAEISSIATAPEYDAWQIYRNQAMGFTIKYPKEVLDYTSDCLVGDDVGLIPLTIFEGVNEVYISYQYFYQMNEVTKECHRIANTLDKLSAEEPKSWNIIGRDIQNDQELELFIKDYYGVDCVLQDKVPTKQAGVYNIIAGYGEHEFGQSRCWLNFRTVVKYYPAKHKVAAWNIGQEANFWLDAKNDISFDADMADSFTFID